MRSGSEGSSHVFFIWNGRVGRKGQMSLPNLGYKAGHLEKVPGTDPIQISSSNSRRVKVRHFGLEIT